MRGDAPFEGRTYSRGDAIPTRPGEREPAAGAFLSPLYQRSLRRADPWPNFAPDLPRIVAG